MFPPPLLYSPPSSRPSAPSSCASESKPPCGSRQRLPHPSRNEQRAISLLLNACHKSPRAPSTPPLPSYALSTSHPPLSPPSVFLLSTFFPPLAPHPHAPLPKLSFLPSSSLHAFLFPPSTSSHPLSPLLDSTGRSFGLEEGGGGEGRRGTHRDTERPFLRLAFRLRRSNEEREAYFRPLFARRQRSHTFPAHHPLPSFHLSFAPFGLKSSGKRGECKVAEKTEERSTTLGICPSRLAAFFAGEIVVRRFIYPTPHRGKFTGFDDDADKSLATTFNRVPYIYIFLLLATSSRCAFVRVQRSRESVKIVYIYIEYKYKNSHDDFSHRDRSVS